VVKSKWKKLYNNVCGWEKHGLSAEKRNSFQNMQFTPVWISVCNFWLGRKDALRIDIDKSDKTKRTEKSMIK
jgi:hypothetical protein